MNQQFAPGKARNGRTGLSPALRHLIHTRLAAAAGEAGDLTERIAGRSEVHCRVDLAARRVVEAASVATPHRGYEALLPGRELGQIGRVSSMASGLCGGVHATASALCLEMALGLRPPPLGIVLRNLLLSCQYFNDNIMHLFVLAGPDYSAETMAHTDPGLLDWAHGTLAPHERVHGCRTIGDIMTGLNKGEGVLYREALKMAGLARQAYSLLGGKYPHSESIVPGGVALDADAGTLARFRAAVEPFAAYSARVVAVWDDLFDFLLEVRPAYAALGQSPATLMDFGQWDHPDHYDAAYETSPLWGAKRWSSPGIVVDGRLRCTDLAALNAGLEEGADHSLQAVGSASGPDRIKADPLGNPLSAKHPWNRRPAAGAATAGADAYSWGSSLTWQGHGFEVGAYARLYLTAKAARADAGRYLEAAGDRMVFDLPGQPDRLVWRIPEHWNTFERNRARAYGLPFNVAVTVENADLAAALIVSGATECRRHLDGEAAGRGLGVGLWGASRGFLAHWAVVEAGRVGAYRISIPSRVNIGTRTDAGAPGPLERALTDSPILENGPEGFSGIDIQRTIQSFDPCMRCSAHILLDGSDTVLDREIDTTFPG